MVAFKKNLMNPINFFEICFFNYYKISSCSNVKFTNLIVGEKHFLLTSYMNVFITENESLLYFNLRKLKKYCRLLLFYVMINS